MRKNASQAFKITIPNEFGSIISKKESDPALTRGQTLNREFEAKEKRFNNQNKEEIHRLSLSGLNRRKTGVKKFRLLLVLLAVVIIAAITTIVVIATRDDDQIRKVINVTGTTITSDLEENEDGEDIIFGKVTMLNYTSLDVLDIPIRKQFYPSKQEIKEIPNY